MVIRNGDRLEGYKESTQLINSPFSEPQGEHSFNTNRIGGHHLRLTKRVEETELFPIFLMSKASLENRNPALRERLPAEALAKASHPCLPAGRTCSPLSGSS